MKTRKPRTIRQQQAAEMKAHAPFRGFFPETAVSAILNARQFNMALAIELRAKLDRAAKAGYKDSFEQFRRLADALRMKAN